MTNDCIRHRLISQTQHDAGRQPFRNFSSPWRTNDLLIIFFSSSWHTRASCVSEGGPRHLSGYIFHKGEDPFGRTPPPPSNSVWNIYRDWWNKAEQSRSKQWVAGGVCVRARVYVCVCVPVCVKKADCSSFTCMLCCGNTGPRLRASLLWSLFFSTSSIFPLFFLGPSRPTPFSLIL